jgi:16S rRNA (uracil1498-N3)-methyltransferase
VLRLQPGDLLQLFDGTGGAWTGEVVAMGRQDVQARALAFRTAQALPARSVTLAVGMPANERMDWLVEKGTELGVTRLVPLVTERTVVRLQGERAAKRVAHWLAIAAGACEQSGRDVLPTIEPIQSLPQWLGSARRDPGAFQMRLSLAPGARTSEDVVLAPGQPVIAALGPEGGWSAAEEQALAGAGLEPVSLGQAVLRSETAALTVLARWADAMSSR